jgi:hypothetical protein
MGDRLKFMPQRWREKARELRELALQTRDPKERRELLMVARELENTAAEMRRAPLS